LDEIQQDGDTAYFYGDYTAFGTLNSALEERKIEVKNASLQRIPNSPVEFTDEQIADIDKMVDKIEDDDDVQAVYTNIA
jgi:transcriptional/translational regulatory protein YebC/TACO1